MNIRRSFMYANLILLSCVILFAHESMANDAIVFINSSSQIVAVNSDGSGIQNIQNDAAAFTVSPDANTMMVFQGNCIDKDNCTLTIYDFVKATARTIVVPHAEWRFGKWKTKDTYAVYRSVRPDTGGHACGHGDDIHGCAARAIVQTASFNIHSSTFNIINNYGVGNYKATNNEFHPEQNEPPSLSPDTRYLLFWKGVDYWESSLTLISHDSKQEKILFQRRPSDFAEGYAFTRSPWSPDSKFFVLTYYPGGFFYTIISGKHKIVVVDRIAFKKRIIGKGDQPYWIKSFPTKFIAIQ